MNIFIMESLSDPSSCVVEKTRKRKSRGEKKFEKKK